MKFFVRSLLFASISFVGFAQVPHVKGEVHISLKEGLIRAEWDIANLPPIRNYSVWLNSGFNLDKFSDSTGNRLYEKKYYNPNQSEEAMQYFFDAGKGADRLLPNRFKVGYTGAFPVFRDTTKMADRGYDSGRIAFNGKTIRASDQSAWYPIIYNIERDEILYDVQYDINVSCSDCEDIFLNGDTPKKGPTAHFSSTKPVPLFLMAGNLNPIKYGDTYFVNTPINVSSANLINNWLDRIKKIYTVNLKIPYNQPVYAVSATPVSKKDAWMVSRYPTIGIFGHTMSWQTLVDEKKRTVADSMFFAQFIGHELGHYYFGSLLTPNSDLKYTFLEGCTEYMALQLIRELLGETYYQEKLSTYHKRVGNRRDFKLVNQPIASEPLGEIQHYVYVPLFLTALERQIGRDQMWHWLTVVLQTPRPKTDYAFFKDSLIKSGVSEAIYQSFEQKFILSKQAVENVLSVSKK